MTLKKWLVAWRVWVDEAHTSLDRSSKEIPLLPGSTYSFKHVGNIICNILQPGAWVSEQAAYMTRRDPASQTGVDTGKQPV